MTEETGNWEIGQLNASLTHWLPGRPVLCPLRLRTKTFGFNRTPCHDKVAANFAVGTGNFDASVRHLDEVGRNAANVTRNFAEVGSNFAKVTPSSVKVASNFDAGTPNFTQAALNFGASAHNFDRGSTTPAHEVMRPTCVKVV